ncbi:glycosyltransferase family 2 protein [Asaia sp. BMEF1]|uniref:glycosyltransferase family 2 protein n=1 Tax=Asaia sp. BMEF1 TaxID=3155932 RepID=UPI003F675AD4
MASAAAALFVQNDADDIGWWMAYHLALGFDALIVIDDNSTDGTWEIVQNAASLYPIEARRASLGEGNSFAERRSEAFGHAIASCRSRFDWVICLESDEYVCPETENTIGAYLDRFADADAITLHWSIFGSNNHVARTTAAPIAAYTRRAPLDFADHALGKLFVRPEAVQHHALDGCHFSLDDSTHHVTASGLPYDASSPPGWEGARILHYVSRNMTHYTRRLARLPANVTAPDLWTHFNRNDEEDVAASRFLSATRDHAARIARIGLDALFWRVRQDIQAFSPGFLPETVFTIRDRESVTAVPKLDCTRVENAAGAHLAFDNHTASFVFAAPSDSTPEIVPVWLVIEQPERAENTRRGFLLLPHGDGRPVSGGALLTRWLPLRVEAISPEDPESGQQQNAARLLALHGAAAFGQGKDGALGLDAETPLPVRLVPAQADRALTETLTPYLALRSHGRTLRDFVLGLDLLRTPQADALACAIAFLEPEARHALETRYTGLVPLWLAAA